MKTYWKHIVIALLIGVLAGAAAGSLCQRWAFHRYWQHGPDPQRILKRFTRSLNLDAQQQEKVRAILERQHEKVMALHRDMSARFDEIRMSMRTEIEPLLTPEQKEKFKTMVTRWDTRHTRPEGKQKSSPAQ